MPLLVIMFVYNNRLNWSALLNISSYGPQYFSYFKLYYITTLQKHCSTRNGQYAINK